MELYLNIFILILSVVALWLGAVWIVDPAPKIARKIGISDLVVGLTVIAFGTSMPEFAVTITAAIKQQANISVGNIVGSNIFNLGFILGGVAMFRAIKSSKKIVYREGSILIGISLVLLFFLRDNTLSFWEGLFLFASLFVYLGYLFIHKEIPEEELPTGPFRWYHILQLVTGLTIVVIGGHYLVDSASYLAHVVGLSDWAIAVTVVAAGTSAPEFATSLVAVMRGRHGISAGNLIGSDLFNIMGVLGLAAILRPLHVSHSALLDIFLMVLLIILVIIFMRTRWAVSRKEGFVLVLVGIVLWIVTLNF